MMNGRQLADLAKKDFYLLLHELRSEALRRMPSATVLLSGGCAGAWYFDWIAQNCPGVLTHIGVEAYAPRPANLPPNVRWIDNTMGDMRAVADTSVDLVFTGQSIEHLWPEEIVGFLVEAHRVLGAGGWLVVDSPNRVATVAFDWRHGEHTVEFTLPEFLELLALAGFDAGNQRGVWLCFDGGRRRVLALEPSVNRPSEILRRAKAAERSPEDSFIWWVEATRTARQPDVERLRARVEEIYLAYRKERLCRPSSTVGRRAREDATTLLTAHGEGGLVLHGPGWPIRAGAYTIRYRLKLGSGFTGRAPSGVRRLVMVARAAFMRNLRRGAKRSNWRRLLTSPRRRLSQLASEMDFGWAPRGADSAGALQEAATSQAPVVCVLDVVAQLPEPRVLIQRDVQIGELAAGGWTEFALPVHVSATTFGVEFRVRSTGYAPLAVQQPVQVEGPP